MTTASSRPLTHDELTASTTTRDVWLRAAVVSALGFLWATLFWFEPARTWMFRSALDRASRQVLEQWLGLEWPFAWAVRSWFFVLVPLAALRLLGKRPAALG